MLTAVYTFYLQVFNLFKDILTIKMVVCRAVLSINILHVVNRFWNDPNLIEIRLINST